jgi:hypothetical protein
MLSTEKTVEQLPICCCLFFRDFGSEFFELYEEHLAATHISSVELFGKY